MKLDEIEQTYYHGSSEYLLVGTILILKEEIVKVEDF